MTSNNQVRRFNIGGNNGKTFLLVFDSLALLHSPAEVRILLGPPIRIPMTQSIPIMTYMDMVSL